MSVVISPNPEGTVLHKVLISEELLLKLGADRVEWGEPDADGFYTPTLIRVDEWASQCFEFSRRLGIAATAEKIAPTT